MARKERTLNKNDLSRKRRRNKNSKTIFVFIGLLLLMGGSVFVMRLQGLQIKEIKVGETKRVSPDKIMQIVKSQTAGAYLGIIPKSNFLIYPKESILKEISDLSPAILSLKAEMGLDLTLTINVGERLSEALWCKTRNECFLMDQSGVIFGNGDVDGLVKYYGLINGDVLGKKFGEDEFFPTLANFVNKMKNLGLEPKSVEIVDVDKALIYFESFASTTGSNPYLIFFPHEKDKELLFANIELFVNDLRVKNEGSLPEFEYIDARYGNKIFYKIKNNE